MNGLQRIINLSVLLFLITHLENEAHYTNVHPSVMKQASWTNLKKPFLPVMKCHGVMVVVAAALFGPPRNTTVSAVWWSSWLQVGSSMQKPLGAALPLGLVRRLLQLLVVYLQ